MDYVWKISGEQGEGIDSTGHIFASNVFKNGFEISTYRKYSSRIKGGNTTFEVRFSDKPVFSRLKKVDVLIAFDDESIRVSKEQIKPHTFVIFDEQSNILDLHETPSVKLPIPLSKIAKDITGSVISKNMVALGASIALFENMDYSFVINQIEKRFSKKSMEIVEKNKKAFWEGYNITRNFLSSNSLKPLKVDIAFNRDGKKRMLMSGNEGLALGALAAGCKYFAGYPITPASSILEFMVKNIGNFGGVAVQTEDEISAINSCVGASLAGVRSMTATSGPGFSLMVEAIGYAYMTETPVVIANIQRGGPSTGLPTKTEDGDILLSTFVGHGDTEKIVIFPSDPYEMFVYTFEAFNMAERYQLPVIILSDLNLGENIYTTNYISDTLIDSLRVDRGKYINFEVDKKLNRYEITEDGISYRIVPSVKGLQFQTSGNEHNEKGFITENSDIRKKMVEKRMRKLSKFNEYFLEFEDIGYNPKISIVAYGMNYHSVKEVCFELNKNEGYSFRLIKPVVFYPFPIKQIEEAVANTDNLVFIEQNYFGQFRRLYYMFGGKKESLLLNKYDGEPFFFEDLYEQLRELVNRYSKV
ncbi:MAG: 2-oxoacid:acceptor oxidoreductase subunit alpha [Candidatus Calescibacterium sp.]|nr:2-oxoacid:acceptor oxidoreductase subunit alpha [Candidatus Calescibacterium sp.]MDW8132143.1 2-oxoacid:acceptor oxidoreductase subunit alpha [Candidatus Calescibacterium sp.]